MYNQTISPKVSWGAAAGVILTILVAMLTAITPDMLDWAGRFTPIIYAGIGALVTVITAYLKRDPDREDWTIPGDWVDADSEDMEPDESEPADYEPVPVDDETGAE